MMSARYGSAGSMHKAVLCTHQPPFLPGDVIAGRCRRQHDGHGHDWRLRHLGTQQHWHLHYHRQRKEEAPPVGGKRGTGLQAAALLSATNKQFGCPSSTTRFCQAGT